MNRTREEICETTAKKLIAAVGEIEKTKALVGLDGFVDEIIAVVDKRYDDGRYDPIRTIAAFGAKITAAAGESSNYELVVTRRKLGGNGPIMADALANLGLDVSYVGNLGKPAIDPVFHDFAGRAKVVSIAAPGQTDALEFEDGKLMLGKHGSLHEVNWENLLQTLGKEGLIKLFDESTFVSLVNWTMLPKMTEIWRHLLADVFPVLSARSGRTLFIDLADPEKRTSDDLKTALGLLQGFQKHAEVILGLNLKEAIQVADVLGVEFHGEGEDDLARGAARIREALDIGCTVVHPRRCAAAATAIESKGFAGPFVKHPKISTGAGDHFNAGFCLGRIAGLDLVESLCAGVSTSGFYVRSARSPAVADLALFVADLPPAEG